MKKWSKISYGQNNFFVKKNGTKNYLGPKILFKKIADQKHFLRKKKLAKIISETKELRCCLYGQMSPRQMLHGQMSI